jgi:hypothetical protein
LVGTSESAEVAETVRVCDRGGGDGRTLPPRIRQAVIATNANAKSIKKAAAAPADRYFYSAHGPNDQHSLWLAGDYIGRDPDPAIRAAMTRQPYN